MYFSFAIFDYYYYECNDATVITEFYSLHEMLTMTTTAMLRQNICVEVAEKVKCLWHAKALHVIAVQLRVQSATLIRDRHCTRTTYAPQYHE